MLHRTYVVHNYAFQISIIKLTVIYFCIFLPFCPRDFSRSAERPLPRGGCGACVLTRRRAASESGSSYASAFVHCPVHEFIVLLCAAAVKADFDIGFSVARSMGGPYSGRRNRDNLWTVSRDILQSELKDVLHPPAAFALKIAAVEK